MNRRLAATAAVVALVVGIALFHFAEGDREGDPESPEDLNVAAQQPRHSEPRPSRDAAIETPLVTDDPFVADQATKGGALGPVPEAEPSPDSSEDERMARIKELMDRRQERMLRPQTKDEKLRSAIPATNPLPGLEDLDDAALTEMLRVEDGATFSIAALTGQVIGEKFTHDEWMSWFEEAGPSAGLRGEVAVAILRSASVRMRYSSRKLPDAEASRMLALLDGYLHAWKDQPVNSLAVVQLTGMLRDLAPVSGGLELIRHWLVETPHGNEIVEKGLYAAMVHWPFNDAAPLAREALLTLRGGAIKGAIECWGQAKRRTLNPAWTEDDVRSLLPTLVDCVKRTPSAAAILLASALAGKDLFLDYCIEIGAALLERTDGRACAAMGFHFYSHVDLSLACATWRDWFNSHDEHQVAVACIAAPHLRDHVITDTERDRILALAMDENREAGARASAAEALCQVEKGFIRSRQVMTSWVVRPSLPEPMLRALGRMTAMGAKAVVESTLQEVIDDVAKTPPERHYALFLLATRNPEAALAICEQQATATTRLFETVTLLLAAATSEAMQPDQTYKRTAAVRAAIGEPEPKWITELRLRRDNTSPEGRVVTYAWSSAPTRK